MRRTFVASVAICALALTGCEPAPVRPVSDKLRPDPEAPPLPALIPTQSAAEAISLNIQDLHLPPEFRYPTITDPLYESGDPAVSGYSKIVGYVRAGDAAIWTGHYLAAEAYRYAVTKSTAARDNAQRALDGIQGLVDVTTPEKPDLLARFLWPDEWWYANQMASDEASHGVYRGAPGGIPHRWLGNATRDQYSGVFFGLGLAYDLFNDQPEMRTQITNLVTRLLDFLLRNDWNIVMPDGRISSTFAGRYEQQLNFLQIGRRVSPAKFDATYKSYRTKYASSVSTPIKIECWDPHGSYYKFNLNHINLFNLIRLEEATSSARSSYLSAFNSLRSCTGSHQNAHFNMIERGIKGANSTRDAATREYLGLWLQRPRRDYYVDLRTQGYTACAENRACSVVPVDKRPNTDFLWQRSPFLLYAGRFDGRAETAAIDYILPYWMARYYGVINAP